MEEEKKCPHCEKREKEEKKNEEINLAFLLALTPLLVSSFFSQVGLF